MVFYKGAINYNDLIHMPITEVMKLSTQAHKLISEWEKARAKNGKQRSR